MNRFRRTTAAAVAAAALAIAPISIGAADAAPPAKAAAAKSKGSAKASTAKAKIKSQVKQLVRDIALKDRALVRIAGSAGVAALGDDYELVVLDSIAVDRAVLGDLRAEALAADSLYDARAVRAELRSFRPENHILVSNVVREAEALAVVADGNVEALDLIDLAIESALAVTAQTSKSALKVARDYLEAAEAVLAAVDEEPVDEEPLDEEPFEPVL